MSEEKQFDVQKLLTKGQESRYSLYLNYLKEIARGGTLSLDQIKTMKLLEQEFKNEAQPTDANVPPQITFPNLLKVLAYLQDSGYRIKKSTLYNHATQNKLRKNAAGQYELFEIDQYVLNNKLPRIDGQAVTPEQSKIEELQKERAEYETWKTKEQAISLSNKNRDIEEEVRATIGRELVKRLQFLFSDLNNFFRGETESYIALVEGDPRKSPELIAKFDTDLRKTFGRTVEMSRIDLPLLINHPASEALT